MAKLLLSVFVTLSLAALIQAGPIPEEFKEVAPGIRETCIAETGASVDLIEKAGKGEFIEDDKLKCYLKCLFDQFRLVTKTGINYDAMLKLSPPNMKEKAVKMVEICRDTKGKTEDDLCDLSFNVHKCFYNAFPDDYFIM